MREKNAIWPLYCYYIVLVINTGYGAQILYGFIWLFALSDYLLLCVIILRW